MAKGAYRVGEAEKGLVDLDGAPALLLDGELDAEGLRLVNGEDLAGGLGKLGAKGGRKHMQKSR